MVLDLPLVFDDLRAADGDGPERKVERDQCQGQQDEWDDRNQGRPQSTGDLGQSRTAAEGVERGEVNNGRDDTQAQQSQGMTGFYDVGELHVAEGQRAQRQRCLDQLGARHGRDRGRDDKTAEPDRRVNDNEYRGNHAAMIARCKNVAFLNRPMHTATPGLVLDAIGTFARKKGGSQ